MGTGLLLAILITIVLGYSPPTLFAWIHAAVYTLLGLLCLIAVSNQNVCVAGILWQCVIFVHLVMVAKESKSTMIQLIAD